MDKKRILGASRKACSKLKKISRGDNCDEGFPRWTSCRVARSSHDLAGELVAVLVHSTSVFFSRTEACSARLASDENTTFFNYTWTHVHNSKVDISHRVRKIPSFDLSENTFFACKAMQTCFFVEHAVLKRCVVNMNQTYELSRSR